ncbi:hypothetical protein [Lunatimonas salinarum]|uniref:hypothetical protein n=1 Tax=Lunatimonas salinarum TaxID=1774590 RepID=UPI001ADFCCE0|nr:hypothetical protein [Lunatimonas salinarum]
MIQKLFPLDKNYILRQAQTAAQEEGIAMMIAELQSAYTLLYNPLRLRDDTYLQILNYTGYPLDGVRVIYQQLCGIYRYRNGSNQLEILFDGRSHLDKYREDWLDQLRAWTRELGMHESYVKTMLRMTLLYDGESRATFAENRCKSFINEYFQLKIVKRKGDLLLKLA